MQVTRDVVARLALEQLTPGLLGRPLRAKPLPDWCRRVDPNTRRSQRFVSLSMNWQGSTIRK